MTKSFLAVKILAQIFCLVRSRVIWACLACSDTWWPVISSSREFCLLGWKSLGWRVTSMAAVGGWWEVICKTQYASQSNLESTIHIPTPYRKDTIDFGWITRSVQKYWLWCENDFILVVWHLILCHFHCTSFAHFWWVVRCKTSPLHSPLQLFKSTYSIIQKKVHPAQEERLFSDVFWKVCLYGKFTFQNCGFSEELASRGINYPHQRPTVRGLF